MSEGAIANEEDWLNAKILELERADLALEKKGVFDPLIRGPLTNQITALQNLLFAMTAIQRVAPITPAQVAALQQAVRTLQTAIAMSAGVAQILAAVTAIANL